MRPSTTQILEGMHAGKISRREADAILQAEHNKTLASLEKRHPDVHRFLPALTVMGIIVAGVLAVFLLQGPSPAGLAIYDIPVGTNSTIPVNETVDLIRASGTLTGEGVATILFESNGTWLLVANITSDPGTPRTVLASYGPGDPVEIEHAPQNASYYLDIGNETMLVRPPFEAPSENASLLIVANESGELTTYRIDVAIGDHPRTREFAGICEETCTMDARTGTIHITVNGDATLQAQLETSGLDQNDPPTTVQPFGDISINGTVILDLDDYFIDPDNDSLFYSIGENTVADASIEGSILTLVPAAEGSDTLRIYASDLQELIEAQANITVLLDTQTTNVTVGGTNDSAVPSPQNETVGGPGNSSGTRNANSTSPVLDCTARNPNRRPIECLQQQSEEYFPSEDIFWEDIDRQHVGQFNQIGNLLLRGDVIETSEREPEHGDFKLGTVDRDGNFAATIWIDSASGDLHLKGTLHEEVVGMEPPAGSYSIITQRSIYLAYADLETGDLYIRGNIIPYRRRLG